VKRDMVAIRSELDTVQQVKEEIEELREYVDRLEEHTQKRKLRLLEQVMSTANIVHIGFAVFFFSALNVTKWTTGQAARSSWPSAVGIFQLVTILYTACSFLYCIT